jgi:cell division septal protein FtsQ
MKGRILRYARILMLVVFLAGLCWASYSFIFYLKTAPRFEVRKLSVAGLKRLEENQVLAQAGFEAGTNVFDVRLRKIRERVEELDWVQHALVERVLPDQIIIKVVEREPIGLGRIRGEIYQFDVDAKILNLDGAAGSSFPILDGLRANDLKGNLKKIEAYRKVLDDLGQTSLSEVHINEAGEVSVVSASDPMIVNLGTIEFRSRWIKYLQLKTQIQQQYPQAVRVDLRFKNQVIVRMKDDETGENIVWGAEKRTL